MKTEDLKNYIFEQLNETSYKRAFEYSEARGKRGSAAYDAWELAKMQAEKLKGTNTPQRDLNALSQAEYIMGKISRKENQKAIKGHTRAEAARRRETGLPLISSTSKQESAFNFIRGLKRLNEYYNSEHTRIDKMSLPEKKKFYNAIKREKVSDQEDREERRERLDLIKHARNSIKNHQDSTTDTKTT